MNVDDNRANVLVDEIAVEIGAELGAARKAQNQSVAALAKSLRLSRNCLESLEAGDWEPLGAPVYASGYVRNYARHLGIHSIDARLADWAKQSVASLELQQPEILLQPAQRFNAFERYARALTYVAATSVLAVPLWWFFENGGRIPTPPVSISSVSEETNQVALPEAGTSIAQASQELSELEVSSQRSAGPTVASLTPPVLSNSLRGAENAQSDAELLILREPEPLVLALSASESAWVEITTESGERLEYDLLAAGTKKQYAMSENLSLRIGNAHEVEIILDGELQDLSSHIRNEVASFSLTMPEER